MVNDGWSLRDRLCLKVYNNDQVENHHGKKVWAEARYRCRYKKFYTVL